MNPNVVLLCVTSGMDDTARAEAAIELLVWLAKGGAAPDNAPRAWVIARCEACVYSYLRTVPTDDFLDEMIATSEATSPGFKAKLAAAYKKRRKE